MPPPRCNCDCLMIAWPTGLGWRCLICDTEPTPLGEQHQLTGG